MSKTLTWQYVNAGSNTACQSPSISVFSSFSNTPLLAATLPVNELSLLVHELSLRSIPGPLNELSRLSILGPPSELSRLSSPPPAAYPSDPAAPPHSDGVSLMSLSRRPAPLGARPELAGEGEGGGREKNRTRKVYSADALSRSTSMMDRNRASGGRICEIRPEVGQKSWEEGHKEVGTRTKSFASAWKASMTPSPSMLALASRDDSASWPRGVGARA